MSSLNPFDVHVVGDPWKSGDVDVPAIHRAAFDVCCQAVDEVRERHASAGITIHGMAGSGKTHLIGRLGRTLAPPASNGFGRIRQIFTSIRLSTTARSLWRHVRRVLADDLLRTPDGAPSQLEQLLITRLAELRPGNGDLSGWWEYMLDNAPDDLPGLLDELFQRTELDYSFSAVLRHLLYRRHRRAAVAWLRGDPLPEEALAQLGVARQPDADDDFADPERVARDVIMGLCALAGPEIPVVFCFDQLEALSVVPNNAEGLFAFGQLAADLHDGRGNVLLISCVQSGYFETMRQTLRDFQVQRLSSRAIRTLGQLRLDDARALVAARLNGVEPALVTKRPAGADLLWPFSEDDLRRTVGEQGCTPRELLTKCSTIYRQRIDGSSTDETQPVTTAVSEKDFLARQWNERYDAAVAASRPDETSGLFDFALPALARLQPDGWKPEDFDRKEFRDLDAILAHKEGEGRVGVSLCGQASMTELAARLKRLVAGLPKWTAAGNIHKLVVVRDARLPISPNAKKVREYLAKLEKQDVVSFRPTRETAAALAALRDLLSAASSGDLANEGTTLTIKSVEAWLATQLQGEFEELQDALFSSPRPGQTDDSDLRERIEQLVQEKHLVAAAELATALDRDEGDVTACVRRHPQRFGWLEGPPGIVFDIESIAST